MSRFEVVQRRALPQDPTSVGQGGAPALADLSLFGVEGMTLARIWSFADAAREFYLAEPWERLNGDEDPLRVVAPEAAAEMRVVSVMGSSGDACGLGLHDTWEDYLTRVRDESAAGRPSWTVTFDLPENPPLPDFAAWQTHQLPLAAEDAYPLPLRLDPIDRGTRAPAPCELTYLEGLLRAIARATDDDLDSGRWSRVVPTHDGPVAYTLELPALLDPPSAQEIEVRGWIPDPRAFEHIPATPRNDWERAQELCYAAFASHGWRRGALARQALRINPQCADARVILGEEAPTVEDACVHYAAGAAAGLGHLDPQVLAQHAGHLWSIVPARPHLRALRGWVHALRALGRVDEAIARCREVLEHDDDDYQDLREYLLVMLLEERRDQEAARLLAPLASSRDYDDEFWPWLEALTQFRLHGDSPEAMAALTRARRINRYVGEYLFDDRVCHDCDPSQIAPGRRGDAQVAAYTMYPLWVQTEGALAWLKSSPRPRESARRVRAPAPRGRRDGGRTSAETEPRPSVSRRGCRGGELARGRRLSP